MTVQNSTAVRNAQGDAWETAIGTSAKLRIYSGAQPASCAASRTGTLLVEYSLASDWCAGASSGAKVFNNLPLSTTAAGTGTAGHYAIMDSAGTTCHEQGSVTATGGGGDLTVDNTSISSGQTVNVTAASLPGTDETYPLAGDVQAYPAGAAQDYPLDVAAVFPLAGHAQALPLSGVSQTYPL